MTVSRRRSLPLALCIALALVLIPAWGSAQSLRADSGMVVSANVLASEAGVAVLKAGGNAVDAAIATGFALAVTHPAAGNIGGGGFMVIRFPDGSATTLDFREKAPLAAHPEMFVGEDGEYSSAMHHNGGLSVGVPGTVAGFWRAHRLYGRSGWSGLVDPAVTLARDGFTVSPALARGLASLVERRGGAYPATAEAFAHQGRPFAPGELLVQPDLAATLARVSTDGHDGFYKGETARLVAAEMRRLDGMITEEDMARYRPRERVPVRGSYRGYDVISMPPPSSGGIALVEMLNILEGYDLAAMGRNSADYVHVLTEAMRAGFRDRARFVADMDFVDVPLHRLTSKEHAAALRIDIDLTVAGSSAPSDIAEPPESPETTQISVVDGDGMAVSVTYTLEQSYGSGIVVPGAGFLLNNEMGDFNARPGLTTERGLIGTSANLARPEKRMLSSMTPTILAKDGKLVAVTGSPGGRTIINTVLQVVLNIVDHRMGPEAAIAAKRLHHQWLPDELRIEQDGVSETVMQELARRGFSVTMRGGQGVAHSIFIDPTSGERIGVPDQRLPDSGAAGH